MKKENRRIETLLAGARRVAVLGHVHPDGDCVGSCLALYNYLRENLPGCFVRVYLEAFPENFGFLAGASEVSHDFEEEVAYDLCFCLDAADPERLGGAVRYLQKTPRSICLDHHITNTGFAGTNIIDPKSSSASEVLYSLMDPMKISHHTAECLYLGIVHDTGVFKYSSTSEETMKIAGGLLAKGVDAAKIIDGTFFRKSFTQNKLMGLALLASRLYAGGRMIASVLRLEDLARYGAVPKDTDGIIDQLRVTDGVEAAMLVYETEPGLFKISLRSCYVVDVSRIAARYGGGGHVRAAGGQTREDPWACVEAVADSVAEELEEKA